MLFYFSRTMREQSSIWTINEHLFPRMKEAEALKLSFITPYKHTREKPKQQHRSWYTISCMPASESVLNNRAWREDRQTLANESDLRINCDSYFKVGISASVALSRVCLIDCSLDCTDMLSICCSSTTEPIFGIEIYYCRCTSQSKTVSVSFGRLWLPRNTSSLLIKPLRTIE